MAAHAPSGPLSGPDGLGVSEQRIAEVARFLELLTGREPPGGLIEIRYRQPGGRMAQRFHAVERPDIAARIILLLARRHDVYVGCAPRRHRHGGKNAIERAWALWADCDGAAATERLTHFEPSADLLVRSGSTVNRHAYWLLREPLSVRDVERANRRLAHALNADPAATDAARILRPPHTRNFKYEPPAPVVLERLGSTLQMSEDIVGGLAGPPGDPSSRGPKPGTTLQRDDAVRAIEPAVYVGALTGQIVGRDRKVRCPFHDDATPSLHVYETPEGGWYCFGCKRGSSVYDLAGPLWGLSTRGRDFLELRRRLADLLL